MLNTGETWRFEVRDAQADRVFLVKECDCGVRTWVAMAPGADGRWHVTTTLTPGHYRLRYFRAEGSTFFNAGATGLVGHRVAGDDPMVTFDSPGSLVAV
ncbi:MAG: hypothetical protein WDZ31_09350 [Phycisphaeraceae bacterium]